MGDKTKIAWCNATWNPIKGCEKAGIKFFFKQGSAKNWADYKSFENFPAELQVREFPEPIRGAV